MRSDSSLRNDERKGKDGIKTGKNGGGKKKNVEEEEEEEKQQQMKREEGS